MSERTYIKGIDPDEDDFLVQQEGQRLDQWSDETDMCPNCVTPWKCNGPHLLDKTPFAEAGRAVQDVGLPTVEALADAIHHDYSAICRDHALADCPYQQSTRRPIDFMGRAESILARLRALPPLHDPAPASESGQPLTGEAAQWESPDYQPSEARDD